MCLPLCQPSTLCPAPSRAPDVGFSQLTLPSQPSTLVSCPQHSPGCRILLAHLAQLQLLLLLLLQELLVLLLDDQVLQRLRALGQRRRLRAAQRAVLPQLVHRGRHSLRPYQGLRVQGQRAQACKVAVWREHGEGRNRREARGLVSL